MNRIIGSKAEIRVIKSDRSPITDYKEITELLKSQQAVTAVSPVIEQELLAHKNRNTTVINAYGINFDEYNELIELQDKIRLGSYEETIFAEEGIIIGLDLSLSLNVTVGEYIRISSPINKTPTPFGMIPKMKRLKVTAVFVSGMPEFDKTYAYMSLENARFFTDNLAGVSLIQIKTSNPRHSAKHAASLQRILGHHYLVEDWSKFDASLFQAMQLEKSVMFVVLAMMLIISGFNMAGDSLKAVTEKRYEIGILKALGMTTKRISNIFVGINLLLGVSGILAGTIISLSFIYLQSRYQLIRIPIPGFPMQWLPVVIKTVDFIVVPLIVLMICLLATIIALQKIKRIDPISIMRDLE